jgi:hypothetical protein
MWALSEGNVAGWHRVANLAYFSPKNATSGIFRALWKWGITGTKGISEVSYERTCHVILSQILQECDVCDAKM